MTRTLWRIAVDAPAYEAHDLSGKGAEITGGRWNVKGLPAVYASETRALACLETMVHLNAGGLPLNRYLVQIDVPPDVWANAKVVTPDELPVGWDAEPPAKASLDFASAWLKSKATALLVVPSMIIPEERNVLINPLHPDSAGVTATKVRKWLYDPRLSKA
ncbi:MAG: RES family NAD+ phosphorylase [Phenylobacterium sp.]|uniref:RES family NAD+ phosphorylase n=1 Tax=Phenylobacterium sp. TaxID=1871053 RepID=UPI00391B1407